MFNIVGVLIKYGVACFLLSVVTNVYGYAGKPMDCRNEAQRFPLSVIAINNPESARRLRLFVLASRDAEASNKNEVVLKSQLRDDSRYPSTFRFSDACTSQQYSHFNTSDTYTSG